MALILHLDTSGAESSVFINNDGQLIAKRTHPGARDAGAVINQLIEDVLRDIDELKDLSAIAVCNGPGSYTGLRISLSTAKGLCYALDIPLLLYNKLDLLIETAKTIKPGKQDYMAIIPARAGEYFVSGWSPSGNNLAPQLLTTESLLRIIKEEKIGNSIAMGAWEEGLFAGFEQLEIISTIQPDAEIWSKIASEEYERKSWSDLAGSEPEYLKNVYIHKPKDSSKKA